MPYPFIPFAPPRLEPEESLRQAQAAFEVMNRRRTVREFSPDPIPHEVLAWCLQAASTAPSGAHKQPWRFIVVQDPEIKRKVREAAEKEEQDNYTWRMTEAWKKDLEPLGTDEHKPFLEIAPALIVVMALRHGDGGPEEHHYYITESVGLASGMLLTALNMAGLSTLTHTPSPMGFLQKVLGRPEHERPFLLIPVGYPADDCRIPDLHRKPLEDIAVWM